MSVFMVPELGKKAWPSLGPQVIDWIERNLVFGPGRLRGRRAVVDEETQALICRAYEIWPKGSALEGQLRFDRVGWSMRKGVAKTEKGSWIGICELHPEAPVRTVDWKGRQPIGGGVEGPYIPIVAYTEEQSEELAYGTMYSILTDDNCPVARDFDVGLDRIMRIGGDGKAEAVANAPDARDGARTTFQLFDETHRLNTPRLRRAHQTMLANMPKRFNVWSLEITTAFTPGENSVAEGTMAYAQAVAAGKVTNPKLFFFHRQASDHHDLKTVKGRRAAVREASGPHVKWSNVEAIVAQYDNPDIDKAYWERVWTNRIVKAADRAFDPLVWAKRAKPDHKIPKGALVTVGFDGARRRDSTAIVVTEVTTGHQVLFGLWEKPLDAKAWEVPVLEVKAKVTEIFETWEVWQFAGDPAYWETVMDEWAGEHGEDRVVKRWTGGGFETKTAYAVRAYTHAQVEGEMSHDGNKDFARHIANARKKPLSRKDDEGKPLHSIQKERADSPLKIDAGMAGTLSWEVRGQAIAEGATKDDEPSIYDDAAARPHGLLVL